MDKVKAIKVLKPLVDSYVDYANITMKEEDDDIVDALEMAVEALKALDVPDTVGDMISRQMAIDAFNGTKFNAGYCTEYGLGYRLGYNDGIDFAVSKLSALPSVQTEIIHCGDCRYKDDGIDEDGIPFLKCLNGRSYGGTRINDFCSWAERRDNG